VIGDVVVEQAVVALLRTWRKSSAWWLLYRELGGNGACRNSFAANLAEEKTLRR
jgi:hypothetical protein